MRWWIFIFLSPLCLQAQIGSGMVIKSGVQINKFDIPDASRERVTARPFFHILGDIEAAPRFHIQLGAGMSGMSGRLEANESGYNGFTEWEKKRDLKTTATHLDLLFMPSFKIVGNSVSLWAEGGVCYKAQLWSRVREEAEYTERSPAYKYESGKLETKAANNEFMDQNSFWTLQVGAHMRVKMDDMYFLCGGYMPLPMSSAGKSEFFREVDLRPSQFVAYIGFAFNK